MKAAHLVMLMMLVTSASLASGQIPAGRPVMGAPALEGEAPAWVNGVPNADAVLITVTNAGNADAAYTLQFEWIKGNEAKPLNEDESKSLDAMRLVPGQSFEHRMPWRLQPGQMGSGQIRVTMETAGAAPTATSLAVFVPVHALSMAPPAAPDAILSGGYGYWSAAVRNEGNVVADAVVELVEKPGAGSARVLPQMRDAAEYPDESDQPALLRLQPGQAGEVRVRVRLEADAVADSLAGSLRLSWAEPALGTVGTAMLPTMPVKPGTAPTPQFTVEPGPGAFSGPREVAEAPFTLRNGETPAVALLDATANAGWTIVGTAADGQATDEVVLKPGQQAQVEVFARAPDQVPGFEGLLQLRAKVGTTTVDETTTEVRIHGASFKVTALELKPEGGPYVGKPIGLRVTVQNAGDRASSDGKTLYLRSTRAVEEDVVTKTLSRMLPGAVVALDVVMPPIEEAGQVWFSAQVERSVLNLARVVGSGILDLFPPGAAGGSPGTQVPYRNEPYVFLLKNAGNRVEQVRVAILDGNASIEGPTLLTLDPGEIRPIPVVQELPVDTGSARFVRLAVRAWLPAEPTISVNASVSTQVIDLHGPAIAWDPQLPDTWLPGVALAVGARAVDETRVARAILVITNSSGTHEREFAGPGPWETELTLPAGTHVLHWEAVDALGNRASSENRTLLSTQAATPAINGFEVKRTGEKYSVQAIVSSARALATLELIVDGQAQPIEATPSVGFDLQLEPGDHVVELVATDVAGAVSRQQLTVLVPRDPALPSPETGDAALQPSNAKESPFGGVAVVGAALVAAIALVRNRNRRQ